MDELEFDEFITYYYRSPAPARVLDAIRWVTTTSSIEDPLSCVPVSYFFARIAQEHPDLVREYEDLVPEIRAEARPFILGIIKDLNSSPPGPINALDRTALTATDNDLLWAEFILTGNSEPILRLIDHLGRPDKVREKLESWLTSPFARLFGTNKRHQRKCEKLRAVAGIACDLNLKRIETSGDLDCLCLMQGVELATSNRLVEIRQVLPFPLSDKDIADMGVKATAKWSLASNVNRHPLVLSTCEEEFARRKGNIKIALQEILEFAYRNREDYAEAMKLRLEADQGNAASQLKLGIMYVNGQGVHRSYRLAAIWFRKAAEQGVAEAEYMLGFMHYNGEGVQEDENEAAKWLTLAAEKGFVKAQYMLGNINDDNAEAVHWYRKAAEQGFAEAQYALGVRYFEGIGVQQDHTEAVHWYRKAAEQGLVDGQYALGDMYRNGWGVQQDFKEAGKWLKRAAEQGDELAKEDLANMYKGD